MKKHGILTAVLCCLMSLCSGISAQAEDKFTDVSSGSPYHDAIYWALDNGVTTGKTETTFAPDMGCTRAQFVTFLWRAKGEPEPTKYVSFNDMVASASPFYKAIQWAAEEGITQGYAGNLFKPSEVCSRGSALTFLYCAAGEPAVSTQNISFTDMVPESHAYYNGIVWGVENGITLGYSDGTFKPFRACSRGQNVTFLYRAKDQLPISTPTATEHQHTWVHHEATGHTEVLSQEWDENITEGHAICNACGKDFGPGDAGAEAVGAHIVLADPSSPCSKASYHSEQVVIKTIHHDAVTQWVEDSPAYDECSTCGARK